MIPTSISSEGWSFEEQPEEPKRRVKRELPYPIEIMPWMYNPDNIARYEDQEIYEMEQDVRAWIQMMSLYKDWRNRPWERKYTAGMLFEEIWGEKFNQKKHAKKMRKAVKLFKWYSSKIQKVYEKNGKKKNKPAYTISYKRAKGKPYGLRLRCEWMIENGMTIDSRQFEIEPDLKPGEARNPRTMANMAARTQAGRDRYNARYNTASAVKDRERRRAAGQLYHLGSNANQDVSGHDGRGSAGDERSRSDCED